MMWVISFYPTNPRHCDVGKYNRIPHTLDTVT